LAVVHRRQDGNIARAAELFVTAPRANEGLVGVAGQKRKDTKERLTSFLDLTAGIEDAFSADDKS
jgi:hypothetical protein